MLTLLTIAANAVDSNKHLSLDIELPRLLAPFTDVDYCHVLKYTGDDGREGEYQTHLNASTKAIVAMLRTWQVGAVSVAGDGHLPCPPAVSAPGACARFATAPSPCCTMLHHAAAAAAAPIALVSQ